MRTADRFLAEAEATMIRLARMPGLGERYEPDEPLYAGLRYCRISRFRNYIIFYKPIPDGIEVYRVLHGARDIDGLLANEFGAPTDEPEVDDV